MLVVVGLASVPAASDARIAYHPAPMAAGGPAAVAKEASHRRPAPKIHRYQQIGDGGCPTTFAPPSISADVRLASGSFELGSPADLCFNNFTVGAPIDARVTAPDGTEQRMSIPVDQGGLGRWEFVAFPPDPVGDYTVVATQGDLTVTGSITVQPPTRPSIGVPADGVQSRTGFQPGESIPVFLAGFDPREVVTLYLYRMVGESSPQDPQNVGDASNAIYERGQRPVARIRVSRRGFARLRIHIHGPAGAYQLGAGDLTSGFFAVA